MKKQIKDLRLGDVIYEYDFDNEPKEFKITTISEKSIEFTNVNASYNNGRFEMNPSDYSRWTFKSTQTYPRTYYLERLDALHERRKALDSKLVSIFNAQQDFLKNIQDLNNIIRDNDLEIIEATKQQAG